MSIWTFDSEWEGYVDFSAVFERLEMTGRQFTMRLSFDTENQECVLSTSWLGPDNSAEFHDEFPVDWAKARSELPTELQAMVPELRSES